MVSKTILTTSCLVVALLFGCIRVSEYTALESELESSQAQMIEAEKKLNRLEDALKRAERERRRLKTELRESQVFGKKCSRKTEDLAIQGNYLKNTNSRQAEEIEFLQKELSKKTSVINLQKKVIQLFDDTKKTIETSLKDQIAGQEVEVIEVDDKLKVTFIDKILFDSGSVEIKPGGKELLQTVAESLEGNRNQNILVEGHTDNVPLTAALKKRFPSNWELSTARAAAVVRFLQQVGRIDPQRLSACGYSYYRAIAPNDNEHGRRQNRRIEIIMGPRKLD